MAIVAIKGIGKADYLAFDNELRIVTINFSKDGNLESFKAKVGEKFEETEGPSGAAHVKYHQLVDAAYASQLDLKGFDSMKNHSHFKIGTTEKLPENLAYLCQIPGGRAYVCIPVQMKGIQDLLNKIEKPVFQMSSATDEGKKGTS